MLFDKFDGRPIGATDFFPTDASVGSIPNLGKLLILNTTPESQVLAGVLLNEYSDALGRSSLGVAGIYSVDVFNVQNGLFEPVVTPQQGVLSAAFRPYTGGGL